MGANGILRYSTPITTCSLSGRGARRDEDRLSWFRLLRKESSSEIALVLHRQLNKTI